MNKNDIKLHDEVIIKETKEHAFVVWISDNSNEDSYLLEIKGKNEMPHFYSKDDFTILKYKGITDDYIDDIPVLSEYDNLTIEETEKLMKEEMEEED